MCASAAAPLEVSLSPSPCRSHRFEKRRRRWLPIDALLEHYCDREVAEVLNRQGRKTWQDEPFNLKKIAHIRQAFHLTCRYSRLRAKGFLTAKEMSVRHGVTTTTINAWGRDGLLKKHRYDNARRCLYEPLDQNAILKGQGGRQAKPPTFNVAHAGQGAV